MTNLVFTPAAQNDINDIFEFTVENWGFHQAELYTRKIQSACEALANMEKRGKTSDHIRHGYLQFSVGSHSIFFKQSSTETKITRILHQRMDFDRHF